MNTDFDIIVIGAGMLSLPGLVYRETGGWAVWAWLLDGLLVLVEDVQGVQHDIVQGGRLFKSEIHRHWKIQRVRRVLHRKYDRIVPYRRYVAIVRNGNEWAVWRDLVSENCQKDQSREYHD